MAASSTVQYDVGVFVAIGAIVDEFEVVELGCGGRNAEGDLVGGFVEAFDVAGAWYSLDEAG